jgi:hypothetical protein
MDSYVWDKLTRSNSGPKRPVPVFVSFLYTLKLAGGFVL